MAQHRSKKRADSSDVYITITEPTDPLDPVIIRGKLLLYQSLMISREEWDAARFNIEEEAKRRIRAAMMEAIYGQVRELASLAYAAYLQEPRAVIPLIAPSESPTGKWLTVLIDFGREPLAAIADPMPEEL